MNEIFKALGDESRRKLIESLKQHEGQTLTQLIEELPHLSRFAVMKHLNVLEEEDIITTKKIGRFKYHYLNPAPLERIVNEWLANYLPV